MSKRTLGSPRNLGGPVVSTDHFRQETPDYQLQAHAVALAVWERMYECKSVVPLIEGNEVKWDERQDVIVS